MSGLRKKPGGKKSHANCDSYTFKRREPPGLGWAFCTFHNDWFSDQKAWVQDQDAVKPASRVCDNHTRPGPGGRVFKIVYPDGIC